MNCFLPYNSIINQSILYCKVLNKQKFPNFFGEIMHFSQNLVVELAIRRFGAVFSADFSPRFLFLAKLHALM